MGYVMNFKVDNQSIDEFAGSVLDSLAEAVAVLALDGRIVFVNRAWSEFAIQNGYLGSGYGKGENYLDICRNAETAKEALDAHNGIREVLNGDRTEFVLEYPCHSPDEKRWFIMYATPLIMGDDELVDDAMFDL